MHSTTFLLLQLANVLLLLLLLLMLMLIIVVAFGCLGTRHFGCHWQSIAIHDRSPDDHSQSLTQSLPATPRSLSRPIPIPRLAAPSAPIHIIHPSAQLDEWTRPLAPPSLTPLPPPPTLLPIISS